MWIRVACFLRFSAKAHLVFLNWITYIALNNYRNLAPLRGMKHLIL